MKDFGYIEYDRLATEEEARFADSSKLVTEIQGCFVTVVMMKEQDGTKYVANQRLIFRNVLPTFHKISHRSIQGHKGINIQLGLFAS